MLLQHGRGFRRLRGPRNLLSPAARARAQISREDQLMSVPTVKHVRASVARGGGGDYHDVEGGHWIDDHVATAMARYPEYRQSRRSFGINVLGTLVVEIEADDGTVGFAITTAGEVGAFIV